MDGREFTQPFVVLKDPHSGGTETDIQAQMAMLVELRGDLARAAAVVHEIESVRSQIEGVSRLTQDVSITTAAQALNRQLLDLEQNLVDLRLTGRVPRTWGSKLVAKMFYLANQLASADFRPTDAQLEVHGRFQEQLAGYAAQLDGLRTRELAAFNQMLRDKGIGR